MDASATAKKSSSERTTLKEAVGERVQIIRDTILENWISMPSPAGKTGTVLHAALQAIKGAIASQHILHGRRKRAVLLRKNTPAALQYGFSASPETHVSLYGLPVVYSVDNDIAPEG
jgi:ribosomal protein L21E